MAENNLSEPKYFGRSSIHANVDEIRSRLYDVYADFQASLARYSKFAKEEAKKSPALAILFGSVCLFSAIPVVCFLIFCLVVTTVFLSIFIVAEGVVLLLGILVLAGFLLFTMMVGLGAGMVFSSIYFIYTAVVGRTGPKLE